MRCADSVYTSSRCSESVYRLDGVATQTNSTILIVEYLPRSIDMYNANLTRSRCCSAAADVDDDGAHEIAAAPADADAVAGCRS